MWLHDSRKFIQTNESLTSHLNTPVFFFHQALRIIPWEMNKTKRHLTMLKKVRIHSWTGPFIRICTKSYWGLFWAKTHPPSKLRGNLFSCFCEILLTNQPTNKPNLPKHSDTHLSNAVQRFGRGSVGMWRGQRSAGRSATTTMAESFKEKLTDPERRKQDGPTCLFHPPAIRRLRRLSSFINHQFSETSFTQNNTVNVLY